jgi:hypothetical protein
MTSDMSIPKIDMNDSSLENPQSWSRIRSEKAATREEARSFSGLILSTSVSDIAILRAAQLLVYNYYIDNFDDLILKCLKSPREDIKSYASLLTIYSEFQKQQNEARFSTDPNNALVILTKKRIKDLRSLAKKTDLSLEAEVFGLNLLSTLLSRVGDRLAAMSLASEALFLSLPLKSAHLTAQSRMEFASCAMSEGATAVAFDEYIIVRQDERASRTQRLFSGINAAHIYIHMGLPDLAIELCNEIDIESPQSSAAVSQIREFALAVTGRLPSSHVLESRYTLNSRNLIHRLLHSLSSGNNNSDEFDDAEIQKTIANLELTSESGQAIVGWMLAFYSYKKSKYFLATKYISEIRQQSVLEALLINFLKLEIWIADSSYETDHPDEICKNVSELISVAGSQERQLGLLSIALHWHPIAAAFLGLSPYHIPYVQNAYTNAVLKIGQSVSAHQRNIPAILPYIQLSLKCLKLKADVRRDQSMDRKRIREALLSTRGEAQYLLPVVLPILLIHSYLKLSSSGSNKWYLSARNVFESYGIIPLSKRGGYLREESQKVYGLFESCLGREITFEELQLSLARLRKESK